MKQTKLWLTTIVMLLGSLTASAHNFEVGGIYYNIISSTNLTVAVTFRGNSYNSYSNEYSGTVTIPSTFTFNGNTYSVTSIGERAFWNCSSLTAITIPEGVTSIGNAAFCDCSSLTTITIPEGVTSIGSSAFYDCSSLTAINIPENSQLTSIGYEAFWNCSSLTSITIPESVTSIGYEAFSYCSSLTSITIPESVTSIGNTAFNGCTALKEVLFEDGDETLSLGYNDYYSSGTGEGLFYDCPLESVYLGRNLNYSSGSSYGYSPFYKSGRYPIISLGENITAISPYLFYARSSLTAITLPKSLTIIGERAFFDCSSLTSITIPEGVTSIGSDAFYNCSGELIVNCNIPSASSYENGAFYKSKFTKVTIGEGVTSIGSYAFYNCTSLKEVIIEDGSETLSLGCNYYYGSSITGLGLFYDCPLKTVYLGRNLSYSSGSSYGYSPFYNKDALVHVTIGREVTAVANYAFYGCGNIHSLTINSGVLSIGSSAFSTPDKVIWLTNTPPYRLC